jgi:hypothetical protein
MGRQLTPPAVSLPGLVRATPSANAVSDNTNRNTAIVAVRFTIWVSHYNLIDAATSTRATRIPQRSLAQKP